jgi:prophage regulatory protein
MGNKILRLPGVRERVGLSRSSIYARAADGTFPQPIKIGGQRAIGWLENEIEEWLDLQIKNSRSKQDAQKIIQKPKFDGGQ